MVGALQLILDVFKLRIGVAITLCAIAGMAMTPGTSIPSWKIAVLAMAEFLSSAAAGAFNQYAERVLDTRMPRAYQCFQWSSVMPRPHGLSWRTRLPL